MARNVSIGQTVASSLQTPTLFTLATNLTDMQVDTSVDEADAGSVHEGASARFTVTAFPNQTFNGTVSQVRVNPIITQNVVTYDAVVTVHDTSGKLLPGMTAQVTIDVGKRPHVPSVPISALLYRPLTAQPSSGGMFGPAAGLVQSSGAAPGAQAVAGAPGSLVTVWTLQNGHPAPKSIVIGLSDGKNVEIASGSLQLGDQVIIAQRRGGGRSTATAEGGAPHGQAASSSPQATTSGPPASGSQAGGGGVSASGPQASEGNAVHQTRQAQNGTE